MASRSNRRSKTRRASGQTAAPDLWRRGKWWFVGGGIAGAIALLPALTFGLSGPERPEITSQELGLAQSAPDVTLTTLDGSFQLSENRGEVLLLYFSFPG